MKKHSYRPTWRSAKEPVALVEAPDAGWFTALRRCENGRRIVEARAFVTQVAPLRPPHVDDVAEAWARKQIAYWAGYFDRRIRARIEALYEQDHPLLGAASKNFSMEEILRLGAEMAPGPFPYLRRPAPYPDEP